MSPRTDTASLPSVGPCPPWHVRELPPRRRRTTPAGNQQRPPRGGSHARRTRGASARRYPTPRGPTHQGHLHGPGRLRGLVPQVVAPLSAVRPRRPLRPDAGQPPCRPAHLTRTGAIYPHRPSPAPGPRHPSYPLQPDWRPCHPGRAESPGHPPAPLRAHCRTRPRAQRPDRAAGAPRPVAAAATVAGPAGPSYQRTARGRSGRADFPPGPQPAALHLGGQGRLRRGPLPAPGRLPPQGRGSLVPRRVLEGPGGLPEQVQLDNARELAGWGPNARTLSRVIRLCLRFGVGPVFIPEGEPQFNGSVENFNGWFQPPLLDRRYRPPGALRRGVG